jgi:WhiB family transcriptional regulator, redox-sensing transcriptional regulator
MSTDALDWYEQAACRDLDPDRFDYDPETDPTAKAEAAKGVCAGCAVRDPCLEFALERPAAEDTTGVYGGLTPAERLTRRSGAPSSRRLVADPQFAAVSLELARQVGVERAADQLGVRGRTLQRAWRRHGYPPLRPTAPPRPFAPTSSASRPGGSWAGPRQRACSPPATHRLLPMRSTWPAGSAWLAPPPCSGWPRAPCIGPGNASSSADPPSRWTQPVGLWPTGRWSSRHSS